MRRGKGKLDLEREKGMAETSMGLRGRGRVGCGHDGAEQISIESRYRVIGSIISSGICVRFDSIKTKK
jgi:hypothetical protein